MSQSKALEIAGGIEISNDVITYNGNKFVVGNNVKYNMRAKFLNIKYINNKTKSFEKQLLKIINLNIPLTFGKKIKFYDTDKKKLEIDEKKVDEQIYNKTLNVIKERLDNDINTIISRMINENKLKIPVILVTIDIIRLLLKINKRKKPNFRKIKISSEMSILVEHISKNDKIFKYIANDKNIPNDIIGLLFHILESLEKNRIPSGKWVEPDVKPIKYPELSDGEKKMISNKIILEKKILEEKIKGMESNDLLIEYVFTILKIEKLLVPYVYRIEMYYVQLAKNLNKILTSLKKFFN